MSSQGMTSQSALMSRAALLCSPGPDWSVALGETGGRGGRGGRGDMGGRGPIPGRGPLPGGRGLANGGRGGPMPGQVR